MYELEDHGPPLVALKEQRREFVVSFMDRVGPLDKRAIDDLSAIQSAMGAIECVIADLDHEQSEFSGVSIVQPVGSN